MTNQNLSENLSFRKSQSNGVAANTSAAYVLFASALLFATALLFASATTTGGEDNLSLWTGILVSILFALNVTKMRIPAFARRRN